MIHRYERPSYPLSAEAFRRALDRGLGRAKLHVRTCGIGAYGPEILAAATHCGVYDRQVDDLHFAWYAEVCEEAGLVTEVAALQVPEEKLDREWFLGIVKRLARRGHTNAIRALAKTKSTRSEPADDPPGRAFARPPRRTLAETLEHIATSREVSPGLHFWASREPAEHRDPIRRLLLSASDPVVLENALRCLGGFEQATPPREVFQFLESEHEGVRQAAARVLGDHADSAVRRAGLAQLALDPLAGLILLRRNARPEDVDVLLAALEPVPDPWGQHAVTYALVDLLVSSPTVEDSRLALYVYEFSPCSHCRLRVVERLEAWNAVPAWLAEEAKLGADEHLRAIFE